MTTAPLGPDSLTWRYLGDSRGVLAAQRAGVLQVMHPAIAAGLAEHSDVLRDPIGRLVRSAGPILGVVFDPDPQATARWVREQHPRVRGRGYHALQPETWFWAHATFVESMIATQELFGQPPTRAEREQVYAESITWYARYGVTMRPVPPDYAAFCAYWERMLADTLEPTALAVAATRIGQRVPRPVIGGRAVPGWPLLAPAAGTLGPWLARATLPAPIRERLGVSWRAADAAAFAVLREGVRRSWPHLPQRAARLPRARQPAAVTGSVCT